MVLSTPKHPDAWLSLSIDRELQAMICGTCGHVDLYINDPGELIEAIRRNVRPKR
jgi:hypothetical protein